MCIRDRSYNLVLSNNTTNNKSDNAINILPELSPVLTAEPTPDIKAIKANCVNEIRNYVDENKDEKMTRDEAVFTINSKYRVCLAENGLTPEDLLSSGSNSTGQIYYEKQAVPVQEESTFDKWEQERKQKCQEDINEYNTCMNEYNAKMAEYNECLAERSNPNHFMYGFSCYKPSNFCYKPLCLY